MTACTILLLAALAFFGLGYVRLLSANNEQRTAIEAAALTAARDLSKIAIKLEARGEDGKGACLSLSDSTINAAGNAAGDAAGAGSDSDSAGGDPPDSISAQSINTMLATIRLDLIIADQVGDPGLTKLVIEDLAAAQAAQTELKSALEDAIKATPSKQYQDAKGNPVNVYQDALSAYNAHQMRVTGSSNYVEGSLALTLGCQPAAPTNIPLPACAAAAAQIPEAAVRDSRYASYVDAPFHDKEGNTSHFVFAGIGNMIKMCDAKTWTAKAAGLPEAVPYLPCIVRAEAEQHVNSGESAGYNLQTIACAQPANAVDQSLSPDTPALPMPANAKAQALYDWLKQGGCRLNVPTTVAIIKKHFSADQSPAAVEKDSAQPANVSKESAEPAP